MRKGSDEVRCEPNGGDKRADLVSVFINLQIRGTQYGWQAGAEEANLS